MENNGKVAPQSYRANDSFFFNAVCAVVFRGFGQMKSRIAQVREDLGLPVVYAEDILPI